MDIDTSSTEAYPFRNLDLPNHTTPSHSIETVDSSDDEDILGNDDANGPDSNNDDDGTDDEEAIGDLEGGGYEST